MLQDDEETEERAANESGPSHLKSPEFLRVQREETPPFEEDM